MHYTIPNYYREFSCVADRCADTCCAGWEIAIDPASLARYRRTDGPLGNRLHNSIAWKKGSFKQYGGRCAFLDESGLCDLYAEGGQGMLCKTCSQHWLTKRIQFFSTTATAPCHTSHNQCFKS